MHRAARAFGTVLWLTIAGCRSMSAEDRAYFEHATASALRCTGEIEVQDLDRARAFWRARCGPGALHSCRIKSSSSGVAPVRIDFTPQCVEGQPPDSDAIARRALAGLRKMTWLEDLRRASSAALDEIWDPAVAEWFRSEATKLEDLLLQRRLDQLSAGH